MKLILIIGLFLFSSCSESKSKLFEVKFSGALKNFMMKGDVSAKIDLAQFKDKKNFYALGAIENLKGEIQIFNSKPANTFVQDSILVIDSSYKKKAALLVYAEVSEWTSIDIPDSISSFKQLEHFIDSQAKLTQLNMSKPFPFLIDGSPKSFDWHVINWRDGDTEHTHQKHINSGLHGTKLNSSAEMLGFYSDSHHAIFTHHTTNMHIHVKTNDGKIAGHLDGITLENGMVLKLPKI